MSEAIPTQIGHSVAKFSSPAADLPLLRFS
jgi:hypothetical protein